jgi:hypothetical protein
MKVSTIPLLKNVLVTHVSIPNEGKAGRFKEKEENKRKEQFD